MLRIPVLLLLFAGLLVMATGCSSDTSTDDRRFIRNGFLVRVPPGGDDLGVLGRFDHVSARGVIEGVNDADGYPFELADDSMLMISLEGLGQLNPFVEIYGPNGAFIAGDDNGGVGLNSLLVGDLAAGRYTVLVWSSLAGPHVGDYELNIVTGPLPGVDLDVLRRGDALIRNGNELYAGEDANSFVFTLNDDVAITIEANQAEAGNAWMRLRIVDVYGDIVVEVAPPEPTPGEQAEDPVISNLQLSRGTYLLEVINDVTAGEGLYALSITVAD